MEEKIIILDESSILKLITKSNDHCNKFIREVG